MLRWQWRSQPKIGTLSSGWTQAIELLIDLESIEIKNL